MENLCQPFNLRVRNLHLADNNGNRATVVQFRLGRQISNLETQVQILAVAINT